jgi:hypothetical protein
MRNRFESSQVARAGFEPGRIAVTQRVSGCYCASARAGGSGGSAMRDQPKERRRKAGQSERPNRGGHAVGAGPVKTFQEVGDVKNDTADLWTKGNLRVKRRDPWPRANALPQAAADPEPSGQDADTKTQTCLDLVRKPVAQPPAQAS